MELDWIETFLAVVDRGGFTAASSQVHRSQSRVSAHIAALEREMGAQLIDRTRRPATLTSAGRVFADHARDIIATVGSARSAIDVLTATNEDLLGVLTTGHLGSSLFPGVVAQVLGRHPRARIMLAEHDRRDGDPLQTDAGYALVVLPTRGHPLPAGLREQVLWREPIRAVLPIDHPTAREVGPAGRAIAVDWLAAQPLVVGGASIGKDTEFVDLMSGRGTEVSVRATVDTVPTMVALVRAGVGIGIASAVALENTDTSGVVVLELDDPDLASEVAVYWSDVLLISEVGRTLHTAVLQAPLPKGAVALSRSGDRLTGPPQSSPL